MRRLIQRLVQRRTTGIAREPGMRFPTTRRAPVSAEIKVDGGIL